MTARTGAASLAELLLVAVLFAVVLTCLARFTTAQSRLAALQMDRTRGGELVRTVAVVLEAELRYLDPSVDIVAASVDSLRLRAYRGSGALCGRAGQVLAVRYSGVRLPEPTKDSVIVVTSRGDVGPLAVEAVAAGACGVRITVGGDPPDAGMVLVYESGSYHLTGHALRYRRGSAGRQPLTETVADSASFFAGTGWVEARFSTLRDSLPRISALPVALRFAMLNAVMP